MGVSYSLVLVVFGYLVLSCAVIGLIVWGLAALLPPLRQDHPELYTRLGKVACGWLGLGATSIGVGLALVWP